MTRKVIIIFLISIIFSPLVFAKKIELSSESVVYSTLNNLESNLYRQSVILIDLQGKYKRKASYTIQFSTKVGLYKTIYEPLDDKIRVQVLRKSEVIKERVYLGRARERLLRAKNGRRKSLSFSEDVFSSVEGVDFYTAPGYEHLLEEEADKE